MSFDGHHQTTTPTVDGVVPSSAPASSVNPAAAAAASSLNNGTTLTTFSSVRGANSDGGRGEYVQESAFNNWGNTMARHYPLGDMYSMKSQNPSFPH